MLQHAIADHRIEMTVWKGERISQRLYSCPIGVTPSRLLQRTPSGIDADRQRLRKCQLCKMTVAAAEIEDGPGYLHAPVEAGLHSAQESAEGRHSLQVAPQQVVVIRWFDRSFPLLLRYLKESPFSFPLCARQLPIPSFPLFLLRPGGGRKPPVQRRLPFLRPVRGARRGTHTRGPSVAGESFPQ